MRVLHVVTLLSPDGAFGGPVRVAGNQAAELRSLGHEVTVAAGQRGYHGAPPADLQGTPLQLFPVRQLVWGTGFSGLASAAMRRWLRDAVTTVDLVHVHLARDLVTLPAASIARRAGVPYVVQPHGMVVQSSNPLAGPLDAAATRRVLSGAKAVLYLTPAEREGLTAVAAGRPLALRQFGNGVPSVEVIPPLPARPVRPQVLFCARLHPRKRPVAFARMARQLLDEGVDAEFVLVGPDEGEAAAVQAEIAAVDRPELLRWEGPLDPSQTLARMGAASMLVLPSVNEPYPMAVLEAMSVGRPVVVTDTCGLAPAVRDYRCGLVVDDSLDALVQAVRTLLTDTAALETMGSRAARAAGSHFSMAAVGAELETIYRTALGVLVPD